MFLLETTGAEKKRFFVNNLLIITSHYDVNIVDIF